MTSDSSTALRPSTTWPSVGIFPPGRTTMRSPTRTSATGSSRSSPSRTTRAVRGSSESSFWMAEEARPRAFASTYRPVRWIAMIMAPMPA